MRFISLLREKRRRYTYPIREAEKQLGTEEPRKSFERPYWEELWTLEEIGAATGVHRSALSYHFKRLGIKRRLPGPITHDFDIAPEPVKEPAVVRYTVEGVLVEHALYWPTLDKAHMFGLVLTDGTAVWRRDGKPRLMFCNSKRHLVRRVADIWERAGYAPTWEYRLAWRDERLHSVRVPPERANLFMITTSAVRYVATLRDRSNSPKVANLRRLTADAPTFAEFVVGVYQAEANWWLLEMLQDGMREVFAIDSDIHGPYEKMIASVTERGVEVALTRVLFLHFHAEELPKLAEVLAPRMWHEDRRCWLARWA